MSDVRLTGRPWIAVLVLLVAVAGAAADEAPPAVAPAGEAVGPGVEARGEAYAHLMRALLAARRGEGRTAATEIRKAVRLEPGSSALHVEAASLMQAVGRPSDAEELARQALALDPASVPAARLLAEQASDRAFAARSDTKAVADALRQYDELAHLEPLDDVSLRRKANLQMLSGDLDGATVTATELFRQRPGDRDAAQLLGRLLAHRQRDAEALDVLLQFILRHPDDAAMIDDAQRLAQRLDAWGAVVERLGGVDGLGRGVLLAQALRGEALYRLGRNDEAAEVLERALSAEPGNGQVRLRLVWTYRAMGRLADAVALARELSEGHPQEPAFVLLLAETQHLQRDSVPALQAYRSALGMLVAREGEEGIHDRDAIRRRIADLHYERKEYDDAERELAAFEQPATPEALELGARCALAREDWSAARARVRQLRDAGAAGPAALLEGELLLESGRESKGAQRLHDALELVDGDWRFFAVARLLQTHGRADDGEAILRQRVAAASTDPGAYFDLGRFLYLAGRHDEAEAALRRTFELDPRHSAALNFLGYSLAERGMRLDEAQRLIENALRVNPWDGAYLDSLGWVHFQRGDYAAAREPLERAAREYPADAVILEHLGDLYERLGEGSLARSAWNRAIAAGAEDPAGLRGKIQRVSATPGTTMGAERTDPEHVTGPEQRPRRP